MIIDGTDGDDVLNGTAQDDLIRGFAGADQLLGRQANDNLDGGTGDDLLNGGTGDDRLKGGAGDDTASYADVAASVTVSLATTAAQYTGATGTDTLIEIENLLGGGGDDLLTGNSLANRLSGNAGNDSLDGGSGDDVIEGGRGNDSLTGGFGSDIVTYASSSAAVTVNLALTTAQDTGGAGTDTLAGFENLIGGNGADTLTGDAQANRLEGGAGNDKLDGGDGDDVLDGGAGNDTLDGGDGTDSASYVAATSAVRVNLANTTAQNTLGAGVDTLGGIENVQGSSFDDTLTGTAGANRLDGGAGQDTLRGGAGDDALDGGTGQDSMTGGAGNDSYTADDTLDQAIEEADGGIDLVRASATYVLAAHVENLRLTGNAAIDGTGNELDNKLIGNNANNALRSGAGNDSLDGGAGNDLLDGSAGNDTATYAAFTTAITVSLAVTAAQDTGAAGVDTLRSIENLVGGAGNDSLTGSTGSNLLEGGAGNDTLLGLAGHDTLDGGAGSNALFGGLGNDTYLVAGFQDSVSENADEGDDLVQSLITYALGANVERLTLTGNAAIDGTGNALANTLTGNRAANVLDGGGGDDTASYAPATSGVVVSLAVSGAQDTHGGGMDTLLNIENLAGSAFNDRLTGDGAANRLRGLDGIDSLDGGAGDDTLAGGDADDTLRGGEGDDALFGGTGQDWATYADATTGLVVNLAIAGPQDTQGAGVDTLAEIENLVGGSGDDRLTGDAFSNRLDGGAGDDLLVGGDGDDVLIGGLGDDSTSYAASAGPITVSALVLVAGSGGSDSLSGIENLTASEFDDSVSGNEVANRLRGLDGDDLIDGRGGDDTLAGGAGDDTLSGGLGNDTLIGGEGLDIASYASSSGGVTVDLALTDVQDTGAAGHDVLMEIENLSGGSSGDTLRGNESANQIMGLDGADVLRGAGGNDTLEGGNSEDDLFGEDGDDTLSGGLGFDILEGGNGNDSLYGGATADLLRGGQGADTFVYASFADSRPASADRIEDFGVGGSDKIDLSRIDGDSSTPGHQAIDPGQIVLTYGAASILTRVDLYDADGSGIASVIRVTGTHYLTMADFVL